MYAPDNLWRGLIYTVEAVSDLLGMPRPIPYRYLRGYSIKNLVDGLHDAPEGLLESLREKRAATEPAPQTILARQSLLMSALFHLTGMDEDLLLAGGKPRRPVFPDLEVGLHDEMSLPSVAGRPYLKTREEPATATHPAMAREMEGPAYGVSSGGILFRFAASPGSGRGEGFGSLGRRRRRGGAILLAALLGVLLLAFVVPALVGGGGGPDPSGGGAGAQGSGQEARDEGGSGADDRAAGAEGDGQGSREEDPPVGAIADSGTEVPDVSGSSVEAARGTLDEAGLSVGATRSVASREVPSGTVTATEPSAGSFIEEETEITLLVSGGPDGPDGSRGSAGASANSSASASPASAGAASSASANASPGAAAQPR